ncbi:Proton-conducting membrane transporter [Methylomagnum ishizawai]|uniref:Proton-conducting membrane transporter n=1 Tax=Methylomagnum ishizawai TaxID=1760988 RepID=A0A1Y6CY32_9GAMM|nr:proton-conducting transporter membrane subunit [Methylomagnum ishizawai]SMF95206.1 Proton-conducting membrane transporter [Methylomagnum ishizawai]
MNSLLVACQFLPLLGWLLIFVLGSSERRVANISFWATHAMGAAILGLLATWAFEGFPAHEYLWVTLYEQAEYHFHILFYLDPVGAAYLFCTWVIFSVIVRYCRYYLHRELGYKRFFLTIFGFVFGLNMVILSGSLDMLFAGWEIVGIASFLLIAFYRHRAQPIRNALRAYTVYRFCDLGLLLGALLMDLFLHGSNHFSQLGAVFGQGAVPPGGTLGLFALSLCLVIAASGKSAQFPFCFWLPRAMEGPTPSSAIFYGALSVHLGVFLLLRTLPIWGFEFLSRALVLTIGLLTVIVASVAEKAQSNIKGQIAYASIAQVGFMFMELALGLESLVLLHFMGNTFLRCYQLLVSPSIVAHLLRVEGAANTGFDIKHSAFARHLPRSLRSSLPEALETTLQVLALQEFNLETGVRAVLWEPLKRTGAAINAVDPWRKLGVALGVIGLGWLGLESGLLPRPYLAIPAALAMLVASLGAFAEKRDVFRVWNLVGFSGLLSGGVAWLAGDNAADHVELFLSGLLPAWCLGLGLLALLLKGDDFAAAPYAYRAMAERKPALSILLFLCFLGLVSFPVTPAFIGEDLLLYHVSEHFPWLVALIALSFVLNGIAAAGVFQRLCLGRPVEVRDPAAGSEPVAAWRPGLAGPGFLPEK